MNTYKIIVSYDGTDYQGWQEQDNGPTIVGTLQDRFCEVFGREITVLGASRTDAGVHAFGQVAIFKTDLLLDGAVMKRAWNNSLPAAVTVRELELVADDFNPHHGVLEKTYEYRFCLQRPLVYDHRYTWYYRWPVDIDKLRDVLQVFVGEHDFRSFCTGNDLKSTVRTVHSIDVIKNGEQSYKIIFKAPGFLRYMIRRMTGAALEVASRPFLTADATKVVLKACNPSHALPCAPALGLTLVNIEYGVAPFDKLPPSPRLPAFVKTTADKMARRQGERVYHSINLGRE